MIISFSSFSEPSNYRYRRPPTKKVDAEIQTEPEIKQEQVVGHFFLEPMPQEESQDGGECPANMQENIAQGHAVAKQEEAEPARIGQALLIDPEGRKQQQACLKTALQNCNFN